MERKIGEIFDYEGHTLKVMNSPRGWCYDEEDESKECFFFNYCNECGSTNQKEICGACTCRKDENSVFFMEINNFDKYYGKKGWRNI